MKPSRIYISTPHVGGTEQSYVQETFARNWNSSEGPNLTEFEQDHEII
jgi:dTDP-4-amino-4,6-dideoxygalactose transaminase